MVVSKVCTFCGQPIHSPVCPYCHSDFTAQIDTLPDFGYRAPDEVSFEKIRYSNWLERVDQYKGFLYKELDASTKTFVDVGCGPNQVVKEVKKDFPHIKAVGFDQYVRDEDIVNRDFEKEGLPYERDEVDVILLSHVLEHLERIHFVLEDAIRASKKVVVALPNYSYIDMARAMVKRELGGLNGLPLIPPMDRHRWIFMVSEMDRFIGYYCYKFDLRYKVHYNLHPRSIPFFARFFKNAFVYEAIYVLAKK